MLASQPPVPALARLPKETPKAYDAFCTYVDLGADRSLSELARRLGRTQQYLEAWSAKFDWSQRIRDYDNHLAMVHQTKAEELANASAIDWAARQEEQRIAEWKVRTQALEAAQEALNRWWNQKHRVPSFEGIARMLDLVSKLGRLSSGMPTDRTETRTHSVNMEIDLQFEAALRKLYTDSIDIEAFPPAAKP